MTIVRKVFVECNKCGRSIEIPTEGRPVNIKRYIERHGWVHGGGKHYCNECINDEGVSNGN